jgi:hypothetical protein
MDPQPMAILDLHLFLMQQVLAQVPVVLLLQAAEVLVDHLALQPLEKVVVLGAVLVDMVVCPEVLAHLDREMLVALAREQTLITEAAVGAERVRLVLQVLQLLAAMAERELLVILQAFGLSMLAEVVEAFTIPALAALEA